MTSMDKERRRKPTHRERPPVAADDAAPRAARLELLYAIGKKLTRASDPEELIPEVLSIAAAALSLRSAIVALRTNGVTRLIAWPTRGGDIEDASNHALATFAYLLQEPEIAARGVEIRCGALSTRGGRRATAGTRQYIALPLAVAHRPMFGALQVESAAPLGHPDLSFVDAIVTELAAALDRHIAVERRVSESERSRSAAEAVATTARDSEALAEERESRSREERDFARAVARSLGEGVVAVGLDAKITLLNPAAEALLGWKEHEALGRAFAEVVRIRDAAGSPIADGDPATNVMRSSAEERDDRHLFVDRNGTAFPVSYTSSPIVRDGAVAGAVVSFENVSALRMSEHEQRTLAALGVALSASLDVATTLATVCRSLVPGFADVCFVDFAQKGEIVERSEVVFADGSNESLAERVRAHAAVPGSSTPQARVLATGKPVLITGAAAVLACAHDEEHRAVLREMACTSLVVVPLVARDRVFGALTCGMIGSGRAYGLTDLAFAHDVAQRASLALDNAQLYEAAQAAIRAREDVLTIVSHDLRSPLSGIVLAAKALLRTMTGTEAASNRAMLETIARAAERMNSQVERLLDFTRLEAGQLKMELTDNDVAALLAEAVATFEPIARERGIVLRSEIEPSLPRVRCDADRMEQVVGNLLGNALKFTSSGGSVVVRAQREGRDLRLSIGDTGPGIAEADRARIFQAFWQAKPGGRGGAGLGLAITRGIVEAHGGRIWVESELGAGSTFVIVLPAAGRALRG